MPCPYKNVSEKIYYVLHQKEHHRAGHLFEEFERSEPMPPTNVIAEGDKPE